MADIKDLEKAIEALKSKSASYEKTDQYYSGDHNLAFATDKFKNAFGQLFREFALNVCPAVVDAVRDKLVVTGFRIEEGTEGLTDKAWKIWQANRMGKRSGEIHKEAVKNGDAYAIVWPDTNSKVTIYPQKAANCTVKYDEETPGMVLWAAKYWSDADKKVRLNLYYPDRVEKYISKKKSEAGIPDAKEFVAIEGGEAIVANPYGIVPVFHFANNADIGMFGDSELKDAMPVQDALNKSVLDMMVSMEFSAFRQRWISGIEIEYDDKGEPIAPFKSGAERIWLTESPETKFGDFQQTDLKQFLEVKESFLLDVARVTGTPLYYFIQAGGTHPSGESLKKSESRFINKVRDRMESFGNVWEDLMVFALRIEKSAPAEDVRLFTEWEEPAPLSEKESLENLLLKQEIGVSMEQLLTEAGYGESDIQKMLESKQAERDAAIRSFNRGETDDKMNVGN